MYFVSVKPVKQVENTEYGQVTGFNMCILPLGYDDHLDPDPANT